MKIEKRKLRINTIKIPARLFNKIKFKKELKRIVVWGNVTAAREIALQKFKQIEREINYEIEQIKQQHYQQILRQRQWDEIVKLNDLES